MVSAPGREPWRRRVRVSRGQHRTIAVKLPVTATRQKLRRRGYLALAAAAASAAAGVAFGALERSAFNEAEDIYRVERSRPVTGSLSSTDALVAVRSREDMAAATDRGKQYQLLSAISFGVAAAALTASVVWFSQEDRAAAGRREGRPPLALVPMSGGIQVTYSAAVSW